MWSVFKVKFLIIKLFFKDGYQQQQQQPGAGNQNSGGKARAAGRGGQNNFKPY